jgi:hypothetical protein
MNAGEPVVPASQHYSGHNRVPNIQEFVERLDRQKRARDAAIDAELKSSKVNGGDAKDHKADSKRKKRHTRTVRDPVTGRDVEIEDANMDFKEVVDNPVVGFTNSIILTLTSY